ncbi:hypothetical protein Clacol_000987 [Clathrus columnatus]|uniref:60S ribosomal export protein NMD3 n=1 Tax=Clathrus columnatus TaxID=1419009 RepID=A0AAV5A199_9AGAM|nr:hypothetical protein Clacol_000987 [Clathrus columnatus]
MNPITGLSKNYQIIYHHLENRFSVLDDGDVNESVTKLRRFIILRLFTHQLPFISFLTSGNIMRAAAGSVSYCGNCDRFLLPPAQWTLAAPESREILAICLKKLKGLNKIRLVHAGFISTTLKTIKSQIDYSKREYIVQHGQCPDCTRLAAKNTWKAMVQVRQKVPYKRTFLFLEKIILKRGAQKDTIPIKEVKDGLDFFCAQGGHAIRMTEFLADVVPSFEQQLSMDTQSNTTNFKSTYSVEIIPICKDNLVCLPLKQAQLLGNIRKLLHFVDPSTLQTCKITSSIYWRALVDSLVVVTDFVEFIVLDVESSGPTRGKLVSQKSGGVYLDPKL